ncbi:MAG TPA: class I SAM-dependent methyltransferase [Candidatus Acidoferrum sp.]|nr:class I SAM-dependent methyltransferase [Candidatus Acidoferrum sp.]
MGSYSSQKTNLEGLCREALNLYRTQSENVAGKVGSVLRHLENLENRIRQNYGLVLHDCDVLDIGVGQFPLHLQYFGRNNRVVGIDFDVIAQGFNPVQYVEMFWSNGWRRVAKTVGRKLLGIDRLYIRELKRQMNLASLPRRPILHMDACQMDFAEATFHFVHCQSVFHHLSTPARAMEEIKRVLRPGGVCFISFHLYTSETGSLDPRVFTDRRHEAALWRHLRPRHAAALKSNAFLNKLRLAEWRALFEQHMAGAKMILHPSQRPGVEEDAQRLKAQGELPEYSMEELLTHNVWVFWQKPGGSPARSV